MHACARARAPPSPPRALKIISLLVFRIVIVIFSQYHIPITGNLRFNYDARGVFHEFADKEYHGGVLRRIKTSSRCFISSRLNLSGGRCGAAIFQDLNFTLVTTYLVLRGDVPAFLKKIDAER